MDIKTAIIFFVIGIGQGIILCDWVRSKTELRRVEASKPVFESKAVLKRKTA